MAEAPALRLLYAEPTFTDKQILDFVELAWQEIHDLEWDILFGGWRGVHYHPETRTVHVNWDNSHGGPPLCVVIAQDRSLRLDYPLPEYIEREEANLKKIKEHLAESAKRKSDMNKEAVNHGNAV